jgi:hypothetical protein
MSNESKEWDVFISHASEDKDSFVRSLAEALNAYGLKAWYDEFSLRIGDSLTRSIDQGLSNSRYGIVVLSPNFFDKQWPVRELGGLTAREIEEGRVILPIWFGVDHPQVLTHSSMLADKIAIKTEGFDAKEIARKILIEVRPDLYHKLSQTDFEEISKTKALFVLQSELDRVHQQLETIKEELSEYRCPYCNSPMLILTDVPVEGGQDDWDALEIFECGHQTFGGIVQLPCPTDSRFPTLEDFYLQIKQDEDGWWYCNAFPKTQYARHLHLGQGWGRTKEEAFQHIQKEYERHLNKAQKG